MGNFICEYCGNSEEKYLGFCNGRVYCRKCISFRGEIPKVSLNDNRVDATLFLDYELTDKQREISRKIVLSFEEGKNTLIHAVCGAGKTELVFDVIKKALDSGLRVGFAIPRRDVVVELSARLSSTFRNANVVSVYGSHTEFLVGDLIVLTTHQLYRYSDFFDLLIIDEFDAFPFRDNEILNTFFKRSVKGNFIVLTATPSKELLKQFSEPDSVTYELLVRYHNKPIPIPKIVVIPGYFKFLYLSTTLRRFRREHKPCLVFVPTIERGEVLFSFLKIFVSDGQNVNSKSHNRSEIVEDFKSGKLQYLVTTSILERGITIDNLQVIVFDSHSEIFNAETLVQISGRVGRKARFPCGEVCFLSNKFTKEQSDAVKSIKRANSFL